MEDAYTPVGRSLSDLAWTGPPGNGTESAARRLSERLELTLGLARILAARGFTDDNDAWRFLHPEAGQLHDPQLMRGMQTAVTRIQTAIEGHQKIVVFGDYDMDGTAGAAILYNYLKRLGARVQYFIPRRIADGYGFTAANLERLAEWGADLVITSDHGATASHAAANLARHGAELIITDHHQVGAEVPDAVAMVNPNQLHCPYPFKGLSAAGVAYKLVTALDRHLGAQNFWDRHGLCHTSPDYYLDLVALATVADMSPLVDENRVLVRMGLEMLNSQLKPGLGGLLREAKVRGPITPQVISFKIAPKINALGRVGDPRLGMQLILSHSFTEARRLAREVLAVHRQRQVIERGVLADAEEQMGRQEDHAALVLLGDDWHPGVIGSIASRIAFQSNRPTLVMTRNQPAGVICSVTGSVRSSEALNMLGILEACDPWLERYGGHPSAAGLALHPDNLPLFTSEFHMLVEREISTASAQQKRPLNIEAWLEPAAFTPRFLEELQWLPPFGHGNREPVVGLRGVILRDPAVFNARHLRLSLPCGEGAPMEAMAWERSYWNLPALGTYDVAISPQVSGDGEGGPGARTRLRVLDLMRAG